MDPLKDLDSVDLHMQFVNDVLGKSHVLFRSCLDFQSISPQLRAHKLLTTNEWEVISRKDSREQQVDEFLKCLPHKGRNCLSQLIKCLQLSPEHAGHQDLLVELKKLVEKQTETVSPTADILENMNDPQNSESAQNEFEKVLSKFTSTISSLHFTETKTLKQKIEQQNAEIKNLRSNCINYTATIQQLEETISALKNSNENLRAQLQEKEEMLETLNSPFVASESEVSIDFGSYDGSYEEESTYDRKVSSQSYSYSTPPDSAIHKPVKRCYSELPNRHPESLSLEGKMKAYQEKSKMYRVKRQSLKTDKESLKNDKHQLEQEVTRLREQLDTVSIASHCSMLSHHHRGLSRSFSNLSEKGLDFYYSSLNEENLDQTKARYASDKNAVEGNNTSYFRRFTSIIKKNPAKRTARPILPSPEPQAVNSEISDIDTSEDYLNPIYQGWLTKEGGHKKMLRKRWCILSSQCFFYFEKEEDLKKPLGILYLTPDMQATDSAKENWFVISNKSKTNMNSCKLDKSKGGYIRGNHASYNLQASSDDDKKKWIETFQKVFETLKTSTTIAK